VKLVDLPGFDGDVDKISPGTPYSFSVTALDPVSRRSATASLVVPISREVNLTTACTEGAEDQDSLPAEGNGALTICVRELRELGTINLESTNWQWYVDGQSVPAQSGLGKSTFNFEVPKAAGSTARVSLEIMDALSGSLLATAQRTYNVSGPTLRIVEPLSDSYGGGRGTDARRVYGRPGETINFTARASSFPDDMELVYTWSAGAATSSATGLTQFTYVIPDDAEPEAAITVSVAARGISSDGQVLSAADQLVILVGERAAVLGPAGQLKAGLAKVGALIPENLRLALKVVLSIIGMGIIALVVLKFSQKATL
jgi:hypothetical protein